MNNPQLSRYSRHIQLPELSNQGQIKLQNSTVIIIGIGGIGSVVSIYLTTAGIGKIILIDNDQVELSNLQRQILYRNDDIGKYKVDCASNHLLELNPESKIIAKKISVNDHNLPKLVSQADIILDATDQFHTRHLINKIAVKTKKPLIIASTIRYDAQIFTINPLELGFACYECLYPQHHFSPTDVNSAYGIFAPAAGLIGSIMAAETIKFLANLSILKNQIQIFDVLNNETKKINITKYPNCKICGCQTY